MFVLAVNLHKPARKLADCRGRHGLIVHEQAALAGCLDFPAQDDFRFSRAREAVLLKPSCP